MADKKDERPRSIRNEAQREELAQSQSTLQANLAGAGVDARGASNKLRSAGTDALEEEQTRLNDGFFEGRGGTPIIKAEQKGTMKFDPQQDL